MLMKIKIYFIFVLCFGLACRAQIVSQQEPFAVPEQNGAYVYTYDDAGNQIFRGYVCSICPQGKQEEEVQQDVQQQISVEEDSFWLGIQVYPVPVKDVLHISWNEENDALIDNVSLYQHNSLSSLFQQKNYPNINRQVQINMSSYYMGVYILTFQLKDGRIISRNITKL